ncbi:terminase small subunit [Anaerofustis sp.]|uniref:terminase small subunit n=1 Tax=Anaerofustis sp. TaxID=1872517 RepID=UPI0025C3777F|nr:terminase small subunit [Anaerofustis sp.]
MKKEKDMTERQRKFADEYLISANAKDAALKAGYKESSAGNIGVKNLSNPLIREYMNKRLEEVRGEKIADIKEIMEYLTNVMRREEKEEDVITFKEEKVDYREVEPGNFKQVKEKKETPKIIYVPTKLSYAMKAAELLGKRYGIFTEDEKEESINRTIKVTLTE